MSRLTTDRLAAAATAAMIAAASVPGEARAFDCGFFRDQAHYKDDLDYSVRMLAACEALEAYRERLLKENVRYAFGEEVVRRGPEAVAARAAPLDTFHVLSDAERYWIARETGVFKVILEIP